MEFTQEEISLIDGALNIFVGEKDDLVNSIRVKLKIIDGTISIPCWQLPMFTDKDREAIVASVIDELADESIKDRAHDFLETLSLVETIGYVFDDDNEDLARMLDVMTTQDDGHITGQFLRENGEDEDDYPSMLDFAVRMGLLNKEETEVTKLGLEFKDRWI